MYPYVLTYLPDLQMGSEPEISFEELDQLYKDNLSVRDYEKILTLRRFYDIENIRSFWKEEPLDRYGALDENDLSEAIISRAGLPNYVYAYMDKYEHEPDRLAHFSELISTFINAEIKDSRGFVREYIEFEREMRLVLSAFRAKKLGRDLTYELRYENPEDPLVNQILAQKDSEEYEPPEKFHDLKAIFSEFANKPFELHKALVEYRFNKISQMVGFEEMTFNRILGYMLQLILVEKWMDLDQNKGKEVIKNIVQGAS